MRKAAKEFQVQLKALPEGEHATSLARLFDPLSPRVPRLTHKEICKTFRFLDLPAEMRNEVYLHALDLRRIEIFFDSYYRQLTDADNASRPALPRKTTHSVFLLNKQVLGEITHLLAREKVVFHHGLFSISTIEKVISPSILRRVSSIEISDSGHPIAKRDTLAKSWNGYMRMMSQLADILAKGHNLKALVVDFSDPRLVQHMTECFDSSITCGFRDGMRDAINSLRKVRGVGQVTIKGINAGLATIVKARMEGKGATFFDLPRELRDKIYEEAVGDWSNVSQSLARTLANWADKKTPIPYETLTTPAILLVNKEISSQAVQVLRKKPLIVNLPGGYEFKEQQLIPSVFRLISRRTLKHVKAIHINIDMWQWVYIFADNLLAALAASLRLESFRVTFKDDLKQSFLDGPGGSYPDTQLHAQLKRLKAIRGIKEVSFDGDLPSSYTGPLTQIMASRPTSTEQLPKMRAINKAGDLVDLEADAFMQFERTS